MSNKYLVSKIDRYGENHECILCEECCKEISLSPPNINEIKCIPADKELDCEICDENYGVCNRCHQKGVKTEDIPMMGWTEELCEKCAKYAYHMNETI